MSEDALVGLLLDSADSQRVVIRRLTPRLVSVKPHIVETLCFEGPADVVDMSVQTQGARHAGGDSDSSDGDIDYLGSAGGSSVSGDDRADVGVVGADAAADLEAELDALISGDQEAMVQQAALEDMLAANENELREAGVSDDIQAAEAIGLGDSDSSASESGSAHGVAEEAEAADEVQPSLLALASALASPIDTRDALCQSFGLDVALSWWITTARPDIEPAQRLGRIFAIGGFSLKCVCARHPSCNLFLPTKSGMSAVEVHLIKWACVGFDVSAEEHRRIRDEILSTYRKGGAKAKASGVSAGR